MILLSSLLLLVAGGVTAVVCIQTVAVILAVVGDLLVSYGLQLLVSLLFAGIPGVASVSEVPFELAVAGGPAVDGVLAVASIPADPGVPISAGGCTSWTSYIQYY
jgi:hypothetical protein